MVQLSKKLDFFVAKASHYMKMTMGHMYKLMQLSEQETRNWDSDEFLGIWSSRRVKGGFIYKFRKREDKPPAARKVGRPSDGKDRFKRFNK